jgi:hypothetical protein
MPAEPGQYFAYVVSNGVSPQLIGSLQGPRRAPLARTRPLANRPFTRRWQLGALIGMIAR